VALISQRVIKLDVSEIVAELKRLNYNLEQIFKVDAPQITPDDFDADEFSSVSYYGPKELDQELINQHLDKTIGGVRV